MLLLIAGLATFIASPELGILALGVPALPLLVLAPAQALMLVVALIPFDAVASLGPPGSTTITKLVAMGVMGGWTLHLLIYRQRVKLGMAGLLLAGYVAFGALSLIWATDRTATTTQLMVLVQLLVLYIMAVNLMSSPTVLERAVNVLLVSSVFVAGFFLWQFPSTVADMSGANATLDIGEEAFNPNGLAITLALPALAAVALGRAARFPTWWRVALLVPIGIAVVLTGSRNGGVVLFTGLLVLGFMRPRLGIRIFGFMLIGATALITIAPMGYLERVGERYTNALEDRGSGRLDIWKVGTAMIKSRPFQGSGLGGFGPTFRHYMQETELDPRWALANSGGGRGAHNVYLGSLAELGVFGAMIFFVALAAHCVSVLHALRAARRARDSHGANLSLAMLGMLVGLLVSGLTGDFNLSKMAWLVLALSQATGLVLSPAKVKNLIP